MVMRLRTAAVAALLLACSTAWALPETTYNPQQLSLTASAAQSSTVISELLSRLLQESDVTVPTYGPTYPPSYGPSYGPGYGTAAPPPMMRRSFLLSSWFANNAGSHARSTEAGSWASAHSHQEILKRLLLDDVLLASNIPGYGPVYPPSYGGYGAPPPATTSARKLLAAAALRTTVSEEVEGRFATIVRKLRAAGSANAAN